MKFISDCEPRHDGLVFIDESYLPELDDDLLYAMDILLDPAGTSELIYDFPDVPNDTWNTIRQGETQQIREFCGQGKMIVWLLDLAAKECEFTKSSKITDSCKWRIFLRANC